MTTQSVAQPLVAVPSVDLARYAGKWYEIAAFPQRFQKGCSCTTAEYTLTGKNYMIVKNSCIKKNDGGKLSSITGKAFVMSNSNNAKLKVQFFWPFRGKYWIIQLADDYSYAVVGHPNRSYLWILSRKPEMNEHIYESLVKKIQAQGFDTSKLVKTDQSCNK